MFKQNQLLTAKYVHASPYGSSSGSLKVYIPELMPSISMGKPKTTPVSLNKTCYANANDCKPSVSSKINTQNYVTALAPYEYNTYKDPCYYYGSTVMVSARDEDCQSCILVPEEADNSTQWP